MCKLATVNLPEFLNQKFLEWQVETRQRKTIDDFAELLGAKRSLVSMWMNGERTPGPKYKERIIEKYGAEAIKAFGEDPDLYFVSQQWDKLPDNVRRSIVEQAEQSSKNDAKKSNPKTRTRTAG